MNRIRQMTELMHATRKEVSMRRKLVAYWASMIFVPACCDARPRQLVRRVLHQGEQPPSRTRCPSYQHSGKRQKANERACRPCHRVVSGIFERP